MGQSSPPTGVKWSGSEEEKKSSGERELDIAVDWSRKKIETFPYGWENSGAYGESRPGFRVRWTEFVARSAEERNIAWAYWEFCSSFGIYDPLRNEWVLPS